MIIQMLHAVIVAPVYIAFSLMTTYGVWDWQFWTFVGVMVVTMTSHGVLVRFEVRDGGRR